MQRLVSVLPVGCLCLVALPLVVQADPADHQDREPRPIALGVSGGNVEYRSQQGPVSFCCQGTLGALVSVGGKQYILSNNHVLARSNRGAVGDPINQPGNVDVQCEDIPGDYVADLSAFERIKFFGRNTMDAAIAEVRPGQVLSDGSILEIGVPNSTPLAASIGLGVKKSGRTTGLTRGHVSTLNVTARVPFCLIGNPCVLCSLEVPARFVGQIAITPGAFSEPGDSGSLIVEDVATLPRPVALLFGGSTEVALGSPIEPVLAAFGATLVGTAADAADEASAAGGTAVSDQELAAAIAIQERHQEAIMRIPGVAGVGIGKSERTGQYILRVFLEQETLEVQQNLPASLEGLEVEKVVTGPFVPRMCVEQLSKQP
jgi:hypothetical protein